MINKITRENFEKAQERMNKEIDALNEELISGFGVREVKRSLVLEKFKNPYPYTLDKEYPHIEFVLKVTRLGYVNLGWKNCTKKGIRPFFRNDWTDTPFEDLRQYLKDHSEIKRAKRYIDRNWKKLDDAQIKAMKEFIERRLEDE